ncbi:hypothetical protein [Paracoccus siganidrum]|uniref:hypothetical protein n=1 Tax=Paracoccus siganidrum TaxID=1276757 RepID=UPI0011C41AF3|nr:hypothetical protein [Paracoccus siganidrum]
MLYILSQAVKHLRQDDADRAHERVEMDENRLDVGSLLTPGASVAMGPNARPTGRSRPRWTIYTRLAVGRVTRRGQGS